MQIIGKRNWKIGISVTYYPFQLIPPKLSKFCLYKKGYKKQKKKEKGITYRSAKRGVLFPALFTITKTASRVLFGCPSGELLASAARRSYASRTATKEEEKNPSRCVVVHPAFSCTTNLRLT